MKNSQYNMRKVLGLFVVLSVIPLACYALAGMYDRYLEMMDGLFAVLKTIFVPQVLVSMPIMFFRFKIAKRIKMKLLLWSKRLRKNWWINIIAAWVLSSFVLTSYWYVFCYGLFICHIWINKWSGGVFPISIKIVTTHAL